MPYEFGSTTGGTPVGTMQSLEAIAKDINERERQIFEQKKRAREAAKNNQAKQAER